MGEAQREWGRAYRSCGQPLVNEQHRLRFCYENPYNCAL